MFYHEVKMKRWKKIKSKQFRKVKKKALEKEKESLRELLALDPGYLPLSVASPSLSPFLTFFFFIIIII